MEKASKTFEQSLARLEEIVRTLEKGDAPLGDALKLFEEGTGLVASCNGLLDEAELSVAKLMKGADGAPVELPFDEDV
jgi:exodeoxyribonuclease VII small subunit